MAVHSLRELAGGSVQYVQMGHQISKRKFVLDICCNLLGRTGTGEKGLGSVSVSASVSVSLPSATETGPEPPVSVNPLHQNSQLS